jgi:hypothetical protein
MCASTSPADGSGQGSLGLGTEYEGAPQPEPSPINQRESSKKEIRCPGQPENQPIARGKLQNFRSGSLRTHSQKLKYAPFEAGNLRITAHSGHHRAKYYQLVLMVGLGPLQSFDQSMQRHFADEIARMPDIRKKRCRRPDTNYLRL